jgi:S-adenosylmethionine:tRNA ribosyltransferase-isomerase
VKRSDFHFDLPPGLIAQAPLPERSASRLLVLPPAPGTLQDRRMRELPELLEPGDLLVFNDTRVLPARLFGQKETGGRVEILIERVLGTHEAKAQLGVSKSPRAGSRLTLDDGTPVLVLDRDGEFYVLRFECAEPLEKLLLRSGRLPLPPYIQRAPGTDDDERYQTVFARELGAVAAPTAGLHFDDALLAALRARGVEFGTITLHVGAGTFQPVRADQLEHHVMHSDRGHARPRPPRDRRRDHRGARAGEQLARRRGEALRRRNADLHLPRPAHPRGRRPDHELPPARVDPADAGLRLCRPAAHARGLPSRGT